MHIAVVRKFEKCIQVLLDNNCDLSICNSHGLTCNSLPNVNSSYHHFHFRTTSFAATFGVPSRTSNNSPPCKESSDYLLQIATAIKNKYVSDSPMASITDMYNSSLNVSKSIVDDINTTVLHLMKQGIKEFSKSYKMVLQHPFIVKYEEHRHLVEPAANSQRPQYNDELMVMVNDFLFIVEQYYQHLENFDVEDRIVDIVNTYKHHFMLNSHHSVNTATDAAEKTTTFYRFWLFKEKLNNVDNTQEQEMNLSFIDHVQQYTDSVFKIFEVLIELVNVKVCRYGRFANIYTKTAV